MCGYYTRFSGSFKILPNPDEKTKKLIHRLAKYKRVGFNTRRLAQLAGLNEPAVEWGDEGEFFFPKKRWFLGKKWWKTAQLNRPPVSQPDELNYWVIDERGELVVLREECDFYRYDEWLSYLINAVFKPRGYSLSGSMTWQGENPDDMGKLSVLANQVVKIERFGKTNAFF